MSSVYGDDRNSVGGRDHQLVLEKRDRSERSVEIPQELRDDFVYSDKSAPINRHAIERALDAELIAEDIPTEPVEKDLSEANEDLEVTESTVDRRSDQGPQGRSQPQRRSAQSGIPQQAGLSSEAIGVLTVGAALMVGASAYAFYSSTS